VCRIFESNFVNCYSRNSIPTEILNQSGKVGNQLYQVYLEMAVKSSLCAVTLNNASDYRANGLLLDYIG